MGEETTNAAAHVAILEAFQFVGPLLGVLALLGAFLIAVAPWQVDGETKHVYALSLPIPWSRYVAMRFAAGALTLLLPAIALYAGGLTALARVTLPAMLKAYPLALALKFLLASWLAYSLTFMLQYLAGRNSTKVLLLSLLGLLVAATALELLGLGEVTESVGRFLFNWPGPFAVFTQSWTLIDV
jgi:hypothetical protein